MTNPLLTPTWTGSIHHDGSEIYVSNPHPRLGETVHLRLRISSTAPIHYVYLRTFPDGEQALTRMQPRPTRPPARWFEAELAILEPLVHYRFLLETGVGLWWYNAAGPVRYDPPDSTDFRLLTDHTPLEWLAETVFYQIFPDRFANGDPGNDPRPKDFEYRGRRPATYPWGTPPPASQPFSLVFYGGDLPGITQHLDYLKDLGVNALYLNPVFTAYSNHKYDVADYKHVDPHFGGDEALIALRQALTAQEMRYILDVVPNHCGYGHSWFQAARRDPQAPEADFFTFTRHPDEYASWLGVWSLPKLNYRSTELQDRIYSGEQSAFRYWLRPPFSADGWRIDVANMLARQGENQLGTQVAKGIRRAVKETNPAAYLLGENFFDSTPQLQGDQWDAVMNYAGFTLPLWNWLRGSRIKAAGLPDEIISRVPWPTSALVAAWAARRAVIPWTHTLQQYNTLDSHDTPRIRSVVGGNDALHRLAVVLQLTYPGVPGLYYGDEIGLLDDPHLASRNCMVWDEAAWDHDLLAFYRDLIALRRSSPILQRGGFQILEAEEDTLAYQRESAAGRILVVAHRGSQARPPRSLPVAQGGIPDGVMFVERFSGVERQVFKGELALPEQPQGACLWEQT
jgi:alpha-glucosidase